MLSIVHESDQTVSLQAAITQVSDSTKGIRPEHRDLIRALNTCVLGDVCTDPLLGRLSFQFRSSIGGPSLAVTLFNPILFKFSRTMDDEGLFIIGEAELTSVDDGGTSILSRLDYCFKDEHNKPYSYQSRSLVHFRIEGDVCIDVVAERYEIRQDIP